MRRSAETKEAGLGWVGGEPLGAVAGRPRPGQCWVPPRCPGVYIWGVYGSRGVPALEIAAAAALAGHPLPHLGWEIDYIDFFSSQAIRPFLSSRGSPKASEESGIFRSFLHFRPLQDLEMSTTLLSAFYDIDFLCKTEKSLSSMLDKKAVGSPVGTSPSSNFAPGFLRRHSTSNLQALANGNAKFPAGSPSPSPSSFGGLKEPGTGGGGGGGGGSSSPTTALLNKENKFRDRSFSENGERSQHLMQQLQQQQVVVVAASSAGKGGGNGNGGGGGGAPINSTRYKTELCRPFEESGACKYGEKCQFAHGFHELRSLTRHPKYKTELCRTFHTIGFCPYGPRCHFIHNADERRPAPANGSGANPATPQHQPPPHQTSAPPPTHSGGGGHHHHPLHPPHAGSTGDLRAFAPSARDHPLAGGGFGIPHPRGGGGGGDRPKLHHSLSFSGFSAHHHQHHHGGAPGGLEAAAAAAAALLLESPGGSRTPPPARSSGGSYCDELVASPPCANNAFAFSAGQELGSLIAPLALHAPPPPPPPPAGCFANAAATFYRCHQQPGGGGGGGSGGAGGGGGNCCPPPGPPASPPFTFQPLRRLSESPVFDAPPSPPDSLSDRESYLSGSLSSGSLSGSESPSLDSGRRLPIFSRLSISDD
ncbi:mRNA decay activator protein ZFP36L2 [Podarcis muralis]